MSQLISIQVKNIDEIRRLFKEAPAKVGKELGTAVNRVMLKIESDAKRLAPVNKQSGGGNLRQSIRSGMIGLISGKIEVGASYGIFVHEGTRPHIITVRTKRVLADKRAGNIFGTIVRHPGTRANPFLENAVNKNSDFISKEFNNIIDRVLK